MALRCFGLLASPWKFWRKETVSRIFCLDLFTVVFCFVVFVIVELNDCFVFDCAYLIFFHYDTRCLFVQLDNSHFGFSRIDYNVITVIHNCFSDERIYTIHNNRLIVSWYWWIDATPIVHFSVALWWGVRNRRESTPQDVFDRFWRMQSVSLRILVIPPTWNLMSCK